MAKLFTDHDPYNIHKILGLIVLVHYLYRFDSCFRYGQAFGLQDVRLEILLVVLHGVLSLSSLLLPLPESRNHTAPMIWKEFRFHSILFANRHVFFTVLYLLDLNGSFDVVWQLLLSDPTATSILTKDFDYTITSLSACFLSLTIKASLLVLTCNIADYITQHYGNKTERTTNSMAYPDSVTEEDRKVVKKLYADRQFYATIWCVFGSPLLAFAPMFGIQIAPLMMTFVRKGLMKGIWYHRYYAFSLQICYYILVSLYVKGFLRDNEEYMTSSETGPIMNGHLCYIMFYGMITALFTRELCRFRLRLSPQMCWSINVFVGVCCYRGVTHLCAGSGDFVRDYFTPSEDYVTQVYQDGNATLASAHLDYKNWFASKFFDQTTSAVKFRHLLYVVCVFRMVQIAVYSTWQFCECLGVTKRVLGGFRAWGSGNLPVSFLLGEIEFFVTALLLIVAGFAPTIAVLAKAYAVIGFVFGTAAWSLSRSGQKEKVN
eukprot:TRINITY_DN11728_c0_g2_i1.p1 TRINITY_DN11728_c0_g2~~TRINITY_DN11728_c0_g2_i1.p1  ORF type:complete len:488 (+),score=44.14 TRINITY_DN11728_c0_g2_i1:53-1516(+)